MLDFWTPTKMSWHVHIHLGRIMRRHDGFEKLC
jgi:hypothetical protein